MSTEEKMCLKIHFRFAPFAGHLHKTHSMSDHLRLSVCVYCVCICVRHNQMPTAAQSQTHNPDKKQLIIMLRLLGNVACFPQITFIDRKPKWTRHSNQSVNTHTLAYKPPITFCLNYKIFKINHFIILNHLLFWVKPGNVQNISEMHWKNVPLQLQSPLCTT